MHEQPENKPTSLNQIPARVDQALEYVSISD